MYIGLTIVFGLLAISLPMRVLSDAAAIFALVCGVGALAAIPGTIKQSRDSRYDLTELLKVQEREELDQINLQEKVEFDSAVCLHCGETYDKRLHICPRCRGPQGH